MWYMHQVWKKEVTVSWRESWQLHEVIEVEDDSVLEPQTNYYLRGGSLGYRFTNIISIHTQVPYFSSYSLVNLLICKSVVLSKNVKKIHLWNGLKCNLDLVEYGTQTCILKKI
jgi:hypothetical protein